MRRSLNYALTGVLFFLVLASVWVLEPAAAEPLKLPKVDKLEHKGYTEKIPKSDVSFEMVPIPGGTFLMGSPPGEKNRREDEGPQHPVTIRPFWMGKCEVTWDEWDLYKKEAGVENKEAGNLEPGENEKRLKADPDAITGPTPPYSDETFGHMREGHPVLGLSHHCCMEYCR